MKPTSFILLALFTCDGYAQTIFPSVNSAPHKMLMVDLVGSFDYASSYTNGVSKIPMSQVYIGLQAKIEYGITKKLSVLTTLESQNAELTDGMVGLKYRMFYDIGSKKGTKHPRLASLCPQLDFIYPLSNYNHNLISSIGNHGVGGRLGLTAMRSIFRGHGRCSIYSGYKVYTIPVPPAMQFCARAGRHFLAGKKVNSVFLNLYYELQKSFGNVLPVIGAYPLTNFQELPASYHQMAFEVGFFGNQWWQMSLRMGYQLAIENARNTFIFDIRCARIIKF